jgi:hypothetical protein
MKARHIVPTIALAMLWGGHAFASGPAYSYVTTGPGKQVLKINNSSHVITSIYTANAANVSSLADATLSADGKLYVGAVSGIDPSSSNIVAIDPATNGFGLFTGADNPKELRFSAYGMLFCNGGGGVRRVVSVAAGCSDSVTHAAGTAGTGLAFSMNGSLIAIVDGKLLKVTVGSDGKSTGSTVIATGLSGATGVGVADGGENTATGFNPDDIVVAIGTEIRRYVRDKTQTSGYQTASVLVVTVPAGRTINYMQLDAEDRIWFTTMTVNGPSSSPNGELSVYQGGGSATSVAPAPKTNGKYWPFVGLAIDPSDRTIAISALDPKGDFGSSWFEIAGTINPLCTVNVRATTKFADLPTIASAYKVDPYLKYEGYPTVYDATVSPSNCDVFPVNDGKVFISALETSLTSPRILKCETISTCSAVPLVAVFYTGPLDDDQDVGGGTDNFSKWIVVNEALLSTTGYKYCGIQSPLKDGGDADHPPNIAKTGSNLAVKLSIGHPNCAPGQYLTDPNAQFLISVARVRPDYKAEQIPDASGNANQPPLARYTATSQSYIYNLSLTNLDGTNFEPGTYEITITDVDSPPFISLPPPIYVKVTASGNK